MDDIVSIIMELRRAERVQTESKGGVGGVRVKKKVSRGRRKVDEVHRKTSLQNLKYNSVQPFCLTHGYYI